MIASRSPVPALPLLAAAGLDRVRSLALAAVGRAFIIAIFRHYKTTTVDAVESLQACTRCA
jgi:hypothetical protein